MPEWAEVRITSDFINHTSEGKTVTSLHFSPYLKLKSLDQLILPFVISAKSRGKELALFFRGSSSIINTSEQYYIGRAWRWNNCCISNDNNFLYVCWKKL